jgi:hypothetical protein
MMFITKKRHQAKIEEIKDDYRDLHRQKTQLERDLKASKHKLPDYRIHFDKDVVKWVVDGLVAVQINESYSNSSFIQYRKEYKKLAEFDTKTEAEMFIKDTVNEYTYYDRQGVQV